MRIKTSGWYKRVKGKASPQKCLQANNTKESWKTQKVDPAITIWCNVETNNHRVRFLFVYQMKPNWMRKLEILRNLETPRTEGLDHRNYLALGILPFWISSYEDKSIAEACLSHLIALSKDSLDGLFIVCFWNGYCKALKRFHQHKYRNGLGACKLNNVNYIWNAYIHLIL